MRCLAVCILAALSLSVSANRSDLTEKEISHLLSRLGSSGCQFNRNGSWYNSVHAVEHLNRKYEYLLKKNLAATAEAFIERAATESSTSGKPYLVKCGDSAPVPSASWLWEELINFRAMSRDRIK
jgi:hypothetical protein